MNICLGKPYGKTHIVEPDCGKLANATLGKRIRLSTIDVNCHLNIAWGVCISWSNLENMVYNEKQWNGLTRYMQMWKRIADVLFSLWIIIGVKQDQETRGLFKGIILTLTPTKGL